MTSVNGVPQEVMSQLSLVVWAWFLEANMEGQGRARRRKSLCVPPLVMYSLCMTSPSVSAETSQRLCEVAAVSIDTLTLQMSTLKLENLSGLSRVTQRVRGRAENSLPARLAAVSILLSPVSLPPPSTVLSCQQHPRYIPLLFFLYILPLFLF